MTIRSSETFRSSLSCMFTVQGFNYDWIEANNHPSHTFPRLELPSSGFESLPRSYQEALKQEAYKALAAKMATSAAEIAIMAKQHRLALSAEATFVRDTANRPDTIPSNMEAMRVSHWIEPKRVFIPLPAKADASLKELVKANSKPDGFMMDLPGTPQGKVLGTLSTEAWRKGEVNRIAIHNPEPLPPYQVPQRPMTASEQQVAEWLAQPGRTVTTSKQSSRLAKLMAKFWEHGDGKDGLQPVMASNAAHRALGRIAKAERYNATPLAVAAQ